MKKNWALEIKIEKITCYNGCCWTSFFKKEISLFAKSKKEAIIEARKVKKSLTEGRKMPLKYKRIGLEEPISEDYTFYFFLVYEKRETLFYRI